MIWFWISSPTWSCASIYLQRVDSYSTFRSHLKCHLCRWPLLEQVSLLIVIIAHYIFPLQSFIKFETFWFICISHYIYSSMKPIFSSLEISRCSSDLCRRIHHYSPLHFQPHILIKLCKNSVIGFCSHCWFPVSSCSASLQLCCYYSAHFHSSLIHLSLIYGIPTMCQVPYCRSRPRDTEQSQPWFPTQRKRSRLSNKYLEVNVEIISKHFHWNRDSNSY